MGTDDRLRYKCAGCKTWVDENAAHTCPEVEADWVDPARPLPPLALYSDKELRQETGRRHLRERKAKLKEIFFIMQTFLDDDEPEASDIVQMLLKDLKEADFLGDWELTAKAESPHTYTDQACWRCGDLDGCHAKPDGP